jgi:hypothetical protein
VSARPHRRREQPRELLTVELTAGDLACEHAEEPAARAVDPDDARVARGDRRAHLAAERRDVARVFDVLLEQPDRERRELERKRRVLGRLDGGSDAGDARGVVVDDADERHAGKRSDVLGVREGRGGREGDRHGFSSDSTRSRYE